VAFSKEIQKKYDLDSSDFDVWLNAGCTKAFVEEIVTQKNLALTRLIKGGAKAHDENAECFKAFEKVLRIIEVASKIK
jgi:hypothetical protein